MYPNQRAASRLGDRYFQGGSGGGYCLSCEMEILLG